MLRRRWSVLCRLGSVSENAPWHESVLSFCNCMRTCDKIIMKIILWTVSSEGVNTCKWTRSCLVAGHWDCQKSESDVTHVSETRVRRHSLWSASGVLAAPALGLAEHGQLEVESLGERRSMVRQRPLHPVRPPLEERMSHRRMFDACSS